MASPRRYGLLGQTSAMRTVGVEEELLLVDVHTGKPRSVASQVIAKLPPLRPRGSALPPGGSECP